MLKKYQNMFKGLLLGLIAGLSFQSACHADESSWLGERLVIKGFGTLGLARSDNDAAEFVRDLSQPRGLTSKWSGKTDSVLGLQGNFKFSEQTEAVVQVISRYRSTGDWNPEISWAFLRHEFTPDFHVRVGRLGTEFYMLADSRLIGYANLTVRPPPDFYGPLIFSYFDGIDASASTQLGDGLLRAKFYYGNTHEKTGFYDPITWDLDGARLLGGHVDYFTGPWQFRIAHGEVKFSSKDQPLNDLANMLIDSDPSNPSLALLKSIYANPLTNRVELTSLIPELSTINKTSRFDSFGAVYDSGPLQIQAMVGRIRHETESYQDSHAAFIIGSYRIGKITPYIGYSLAKSKYSNISTQLPGLTDIAREIASTTHAAQHTVTLGTRWDFRENWALKLQYDAIRGKRESTFLFRGPDVQWDGSMNVISATLDFAF